MGTVPLVYQHCRAQIDFRMPGFKRARIGLGVILVLGATLSCNSDTNTGTQWSGTYSVPDELGGGSGAISFVVQTNNTRSVSLFQGRSQAIRRLAATLTPTVSRSITTNSQSRSPQARGHSPWKVNLSLQLRPPEIYSVLHLTRFPYLTGRRRRCLQAAIRNVKPGFRYGP